MTISEAPVSGDVTFSGAPEAQSIALVGGRTLSVYQHADGNWVVLDCRSATERPYRDGLTYLRGNGFDAE